LLRAVDSIQGWLEGGLAGWVLRRAMARRILCPNYMSTSSGSIHRAVSSMSPFQYAPPHEVGVAVYRLKCFTPK
jgi:hypothetical protein